MYISDRFDIMNMSPMQNPNDLYSYYPTSLYQPFGTFDEHNQWGSTDPLQFHPQMYTPTGLDISRNTFDYPPPTHPYPPQYHPGFTPSTGTSPFDMSWNPHNHSIQQQIPLIGSNNNNNNKSSIYDEYPSTNGGVGDMLAQHINSVNLGNNDTTNNLNILSSKDQQQYQINSTNPSLSRSSGPKSYASVVSSDTINSTNSNKSIPSNSNLTIRSTNEQNPRGYNSRYQQQQQQQQQQSFPNWTNNNNNSDRSSNTKRSSETPDHQYNPKDFNLNPKGARFFVIKSVSTFFEKKKTKKCFNFFVFI
jgi:hypothetical protein